jgi:hypothetical protein
MIRVAYVQRSLLEVLLPDGEKLWDPVLRHIDADLEDEGLLDVMSTPSLSHLRRGPGRPRKTEATPTGLTSAHGDERDKEAQVASASRPLESRLLDLARTAQYLGISAWTVRDLEANGTLRRVSIPLAGGRALRKLLFDRADLDRLVDAWKAPALTPPPADRYPKAPVRAGQR